MIPRRNPTDYLRLRRSRAQILQRSCVRRCVYVTKISRRRIDKYNAFCMQILLILLISNLALHESLLLSIKGNIKVYMVNSSAPRAGELEVCM